MDSLFGFWWFFMSYNSFSLYFLARLLSICHPLSLNFKGSTFVNTAAMCLIDVYSCVLVLPMVSCSVVRICFDSWLNRNCVTYFSESIISSSMLLISPSCSLRILSVTSEMALLLQKKREKTHQRINLSFLVLYSIFVFFQLKTSSHQSGIRVLDDHRSN